MITPYFLFDVHLYFSRSCLVLRGVMLHGVGWSRFWLSARRRYCCNYNLSFVRVIIFW